MIDLCALGKFAEALEIAQNSLNIAVAELDPKGPLILSCHELLYWIYLNLERPSESESAARSAERIRAERRALFAEKFGIPIKPVSGSEIRPAQHRPLESMQAVASAFMYSKRFSLAAPLLELVVDRADTTTSVDIEYLASTLASLAECKWRLSELSAAEVLCDRAIDLRGVVGIPKEQWLLGHLDLFEAVYLQSGRWSESQYYSKLSSKMYEDMGF